MVDDVFISTYIQLTKSSQRISRRCYNPDREMEYAIQNMPIKETNLFSKNHQLHQIVKYKYTCILHTKP